MKFKGFELTEEQLKVLNSAKELKPGIPLIIDAGAGATKTFTSNAAATKVFMDKSILVLAYNSIIVEEMKGEFPDNCTVLTAHSFAKANIKPFKEGRLNTPITIQLIENELKLPRSINGVSKQTFASIILKIITKFCVSDRSSIDEFIAANLSRFLKPGLLAVKRHLIDYTKKLWTSMTDRTSSFPTTHDVYLKEFVLELEMGKIQLDYDVVILDEGQDTTPVVRRMLELLNSIVLIVGDKYQAIYEWRDAVNVMEDYIENGNPVNRLTTCYRFGPEVAELANMLINEYYGVNPEFYGNPNKSTEIIAREPTSRTAQSLMLFRTNAELMSSLICKYEQGYSCCILKKPQEYICLIDDAQRLYSGQKLLKGPLRLFNKWAEFSEYARSENGGEFKAFCNNIEKYGFAKIRSVVMKSIGAAKESADFIFATAHATKGIEHNSVVIGPDFDAFINRAEGSVKKQEVNLLYVALTRAKLNLDISQCYTLQSLLNKPSNKLLSMNKMRKKRQAASALFG